MVSIDGGPRALPATSRDSREQHEHHFLDPSCRICTGWGETREGRRGSGQAWTGRGLQQQHGFMTWGDGGRVSQVTSKRTWFKPSL